ncbi:hypothetical protein PoB_001995400 [Plakobranchus ocellatus]|uniref:Uncharacterized protein n=1 Tax=Plakobranchus ocellatus TaxID=259542 RepID=A0AAV3ZDI3_9GAST|nr:hypothetical protein PoB_001995400 [Plakobranchus ocellatus]
MNIGIKSINKGRRRACLARAPFPRVPRGILFTSPTITAPARTELASGDLYDFACIETISSVLHPQFEACKPNATISSSIV